ncbi:hypothetical protein SHAb15599_00047 [Acinetobacter phage SH-Ab 15599]|nr:hypothetical protein SHAb15599_00047 [Acinetobacter phage SH-Ab 15599]
MKTILIAALLLVSMSSTAFVYNSKATITARCKSPVDGKVYTFTGPKGNFEFTSVRVIEIRTKHAIKIFPVESCELTVNE